ncbi:ComF family protein [Arthrobacter echini]|uniref:ComF family protein n=1 Tax=Arthrobacter echini TaxID=1529066 RepID=A0A4V3Z5C5_9MICC|nr:ComF family protein [Arthrobacter echini]
MARAVSGFCALVLPASCVVCGAWDSSLCPACLARFRRDTARAFRAEAGALSLPDVRRARDPRGAGDPAEVSFGALPVVAAGRYGPVVAAVLLAYKNHGHVDLADPAARALAAALHAAARDAVAENDEVLLVPVPTRSSSRRRRGYDPVMLLLSHLRRSAALPAGTELGPLVRHRPFGRLAWLLRSGGRLSARTLLTASLPGRGGQKGLGRRQRRASVLHSMDTTRRGRDVLAGRNCIVVDDVLTTGATISEVHRVLVANGARVLGAVVIAATAPPEGRARGPG